MSRGATRVAIDVGGVGYDVAVPLGSEFLARDGTAPDDGPVLVWTHLVVREDAQLLFGFPDQPMREVFRLLLSVRGVGPALALGILSALSGDALLAAVAAGDAAALQRIKGVGKKTAEQIVLDLRDRAPGAGASDVVVPAARSRMTADAVAALVSIGYSEKQAKKSVERAAERVQDADLELLVRSALQE